MKRSTPILAIFCIISSISLLLAGCNGGGSSGNSQSIPPEQSSLVSSLASSEEAPPEQPADGENSTAELAKPQVTIEMDDGKQIVVELYAEYAPNTVANFVSLVEQGYYDGLTFHRIVPDFMIQGGDDNKNGPGYSINGEFSGNGFAQNTLSHERGVISMARTGDPDSAGAQFFICVADAKMLDGQYAAFGKVISGMEVADEIVAGEARNEMAVNPRVMQKVTVDTFGEEWPEPVSN